MQSKISKQVQNSDKNTEIKYLDCGKIFVGYGRGSVREFSFIENKTVHEQKILEYDISSMAKTSDNKS